MSSNATPMHPFFSKDAFQPNLKGYTSQDGPATTDDVTPPLKQHNTKIRAAGKGQMTLGQILGREQMKEIGTHATSAAEPDSARRKRRKTSQDASVDCGDAVAGSVPRPDLAQHTSIDVPEDINANTQAATSTPPRKMLKLNAKGTLGSPTAKSDESKSSKRRGRPRKDQETTTPKQLIVCIRYAVSGNPTGHKIDQILANQLTVDVPRAKPTPKKPRTPRKPARSTHPFFTDKPKAAKTTNPDSPRKTAAITPGKLRMRAQVERGGPFDDAAVVLESALLKDRLMVKHPGAKEPLWPAKGMSHVRGDIEHVVCGTTLPRRKHKHKQPSVAHSILAEYAQQLVSEADPPLRPDGFTEPRLDLRIPEKLMLSGVDIAKLIRKEIHTPLGHGLVDELAPSSPHAHPALEHLHQSIPAYLSAYDNLQGETHSWAQKYAPERAEHVLQPPKEMQVLKTWLQSLAVNAVDIVKHDQAPKDPTKRKKKRKVRHSDMDDFIADEEDDTRSMCTISDTENASSQSMIQTQINGIRASNAVLVSGPNGCGKTAAVYAVAKELQYRVFEISPSERRAGKDVLDKIGNVTENHIVTRHNIDEADLSASEDKQRIDAAFMEDLETGRQGKMSAFFKPTTKIVHKKPAAAVKAKVMERVEIAIKKAAKDQQQSLILLEEVDLLFKEDKDFWTTVMRLISTSKRPFIMTCNDEDLVPIQAMPLHAVLRFEPPDESNAIDYLLLVAAREGHLLQREAVSHLWHKYNDLRQSLTQLAFWCQKGVGDVRDGLGWMLQRWPPGSDLDEKKRPLRVVSRDTYLAGMDDLEQLSTKSTPSPSVGQYALAQFDASLQALSHVAVFSKTPQLDPSLPPMAPNRRTHYIEGLALLDAPEHIDHTGLQAEIEASCTQLIQTCFPQMHLPKTSMSTLNRKAFTAFDGLAYPASTSFMGMETSVFDGPLAPIVLDVAPYVRQVVHYEDLLRGQRDAIAGPGKRARTTRAARSALEGGQRRLVRKERWWEDAGDLSGVLDTAGSDWVVHDNPASPSLSTQTPVEVKDENM